jgi:hypothetical protein
MDEMLPLLRACWGEDRIDQHGSRLRADVIALEPKPPQRERIPIWIGGSGAAAFRRVGQFGDGWMGSAGNDRDRIRVAIDEIRRNAEAAGRDPMTIGLQAMLAPPPRSPGGKAFYSDHDRVVRTAEEVSALGFGWIAVNATAVFQAGARTVDALIEQLSALHTLRRAGDPVHCAARRRTSRQPQAGTVIVLESRRPPGPGEQAPLTVTPVR